VEARLIVAYGLMALMALFITGLVLWLRYNSHASVAARGRRRDRETYKQQMAAQDTTDED
jgi:hypothetical protein